MVPLSNLLLKVGLQTDFYLIIAVVVLLLISAFFSASEMAFSTCSSLRIKSLADDNVKGSRKALIIIENYQKTLTTILVGNNIVNIASTTICAYLFSSWILNPTVANLVNTAVMTIVILIFGEILPKSIAKINPENLALRFSYIMWVIIKLLTPITFLFLTIQKALIRKKETTSEQTPTVTEDELESIIDTMEEEGVIDSNDADLIQGVLDLGVKCAYDIMTPRIEVEAISIKENREIIKQLFVESNYSRLPVYTKDIDHIVGILNYKDFFASEMRKDKKSIRNLMTDPLFINENMKVDDIIREMQKSKKHQAVVLDEYGGTCGIVCMEDAIEEMIGEIYDEHDDIEDDTLLQKIDNDNYIVDSNIDLEKLFEKLEIERLPQTDKTTLGGFLFELAERVPKKNQQLTFKTIDEKVDKFGNYREEPVELLFTITNVKDRRIDKVALKIKRFNIKKLKSLKDSTKNIVDEKNVLPINNDEIK